MTASCKPKLSRQSVKIPGIAFGELEAPNHWALSTMDEICKIIGGSQPPKSTFKDEPQDGYIRLLQIRDYKSDRYPTYIPEELAKRFCDENDIMIGRYGPPIFQILRGLSGAYNVALMKAVPAEGIDKDFLYYFLQNPRIRYYVEFASQRTAGQSGVNKTHLMKYPVFVPPLNEQRRIVAKIEELTARSRNAKQALDAIPPLLERFRQSVLAAAFRGDLTKQWRQQNPNTEPTWFEDALSSGQAALDEKTKRKHRYWGSGQVAESVDPTWDSLPPGWQWRRVKELGFDQNSVVQIGPMSMKSKEFTTSGRQVLNVGCVQWGYLKMTKCNYLPESRAKDFERYSLLPGDVMFTRSGTVGRSAVIPEAHSGSLMTFHLLRVRTSPELYLPQLLLYAFQGCPAVLQQIQESAMGATRAGFNTKLLEGILLPVPPPEEQEVLVDILDSLSGRITLTQSSLAQQASRLDQLDQSILAKAFRGELVPRDPSDEPASALLTRILANRESAKQKAEK